MTKKTNEQTKYLIVYEQAEAVPKTSLDACLEHLREKAFQWGYESFPEMMVDYDVKVYEVKQAIVIEEEVKRTIKINGQIVSI